jgi:acyl carrier protein
MNQPELQSADDVRQDIRTYILNEFLPGEDASELQPDTPLITGGILDSISTVMLVSYLEERFHIKFSAHEINPEHLDTLDRITATVRGKGR